MISSSIPVCVCVCGGEEGGRREDMVCDSMHKQRRYSTSSSGSSFALTMPMATAAPITRPLSTSVGWCLWSETRERAVSIAKRKATSIRNSLRPERW